MSKPEGTCQYVQKSRFDAYSATICMRRAKENGYCAHHDPEELAKERERVRKHEQITAVRGKLNDAYRELGAAIAHDALDHTEATAAAARKLLAKCVALTKRLRKLTKS